MFEFSSALHEVRRLRGTAPPKLSGVESEFLDQLTNRPRTPIAVIIPTYNEAPTVASVVRAIPPRLSGLATDVMVIDDGSTDDTASLAAAAGAAVCRIPAHVGHGLALQLGYSCARRQGARIICTIDGDGQYEPKELASLVDPIAAGHADFVSGSRVLGSDLTSDSFRRFGIRMFGPLVTLLVRRKITDPACGIRAMTAAVTAITPLRQRQYQSAELLIGAIERGFRAIEVPTTMRDRPPGATRTKKGSNLLYGPRFGRVVIFTWLRELYARRRRQLPPMSWVEPVSDPDQTASEDAPVA